MSKKENNLSKAGTKRETDKTNKDIYLKLCLKLRFKEEIEGNALIGFWTEFQVAGPELDHYKLFLDGLDLLVWNECNIFLSNDLQTGDNLRIKAHSGLINTTYTKYTFIIIDWSFHEADVRKSVMPTVMTDKWRRKKIMN